MFLSDVLLKSRAEQSDHRRPPVFIRLTGLKVVIPARVVVRRRLVRVFGEVVKVAGVGGGGDLDQRTRFRPKGRGDGDGGDSERNLRQA